MWQPTNQPPAASGRVRRDGPGDVERCPDPATTRMPSKPGRRRRTASGPAGGRSSPASASSQASCAVEVAHHRLVGLEAAVEHVEHDGLAGHEVDDRAARSAYSRMTMLTSRGVALAPGVIGGVAAAAARRIRRRPRRPDGTASASGRGRRTGAVEGCTAPSCGTRRGARSARCGSPLTLRGCARSVRAPRRRPEDGCAGVRPYRCTDRPGAPGVAARVTATPTDPVAARARHRPAACARARRDPSGAPADPAPAVRLEGAGEAVRRRRGGRRHRPRDRRRRVLLDARPVGLGQDDDPAHDRGLRAADRRAGCCSTASDVTAARPVRARREHRVPGLRAVPAHDGRRQRRLRPRRSARCRKAERDAARRRGAARWSASRATSGRKPAPALGRPAAAGRARARARQPAPRPAARRAARRARPQAPRGDADRAQAHPAGGRDHVHLRDPRPGGGAHDERPDRGLQPRPDRAGRRARPRSTSSPRRGSWRASSARPTC